MKVAKIKAVGKKPVFDLSVKEAEHYVLENGVVTHNTGLYLSSSDVWIIGRSQEKDNSGKELLGYNFLINIDKSRYVREKSKIPIEVSFEHGVFKWSGLFDLAKDGGFILNEKQGWYQLPDNPEKSYRKSEIEESDTFWEEMIQNPQFKKYIERRFKLVQGEDNDSE